MVWTCTFHSCPLTPAVSKASSGAMEMIPVYAVSGTEQFLLQAVGNGWTVLGTVGAEQTRGKEQETGSENKEVGKRSRKPVLDCHEYSVDGPTIVVLGEIVILSVLFICTWCAKTSLLDYCGFQSLCNAILKSGWIQRQIRFACGGTHAYTLIWLVNTLQPLFERCCRIFENDSSYSVILDLQEMKGTVFTVEWRRFAPHCWPSLHSGNCLKVLTL